MKIRGLSDHLGVCMNKFIGFAVALLAAVMIVRPAAAADLPVKAPYGVSDVGFTWTGWYAGINAGYGFGKTSWASGAISTGDFDVKGFVAGGQLGYNWQYGRFVYGIESDLDYSAIKGSTSVAACAGCETKNTWLGSTRARVGYAYDRWLPYITGGLAYGGIKLNAPGLSETKTRIGWDLGVGVEYAFYANWTARVEYLYTDLGKTNCGFCAAGTDVKFNANLIRAAVNYRF